MDPKNIDPRNADPKNTDHVQPPSVVTTVTALAGQLTYKVLAYRELDYPEVTRLISMLLEQGWIEEPQAGETATVYTSIGLSPSSVPVETPKPVHPLGIERWLDVGL
ncbi:MAG: hypothetical protein GKR94_15760 [Gammaproteobacteria bacterium]|nr:hypothetical protein [Gammaproteobacteria bacterium]